MRVLLSTIGSRGDVQPLVALALALRAHDQDVRLCTPPDFRDWIESFGLPVVSIGPELGKPMSSGSATPLSPDPRPLPAHRKSWSRRSTTSTTGHSG